MATRIRLRRVGRKKQASFRIVVAGSMHSNSGRVTETIGNYNPRTRPSYIEVDEARALHWLREGAEMSESVRPLFRQLGILRKFAEKAEGEGSAVRGDREGRTVLATRPGAAEATPMEESEKAVEKKKARPEAKGTPESEAKPPEAKPLDVKGPEAKGSEAAAASSESGAEVEEVATEEVAEAEEGGKEE
jgi:small subunit ribosomal protein S16